MAGKSRPDGRRPSAPLLGYGSAGWRPFPRGQYANDVYWAPAPAHARCRSLTPDIANSPRRRRLAGPTVDTASSKSPTAPKATRVTAPANVEPMLRDDRVGLFTGRYCQKAVLLPGYGQGPLCRAGVSTTCATPRKRGSHRNPSAAITRHCERHGARGWLPRTVVAARDRKEAGRERRACAALTERAALEDGAALCRGARGRYGEVRPATLRLLHQTHRARWWLRPAEPGASSVAAATGAERRFPKAAAGSSGLRDPAAACAVRTDFRAGGASAYWPDRTGRVPADEMRYAATPAGPPRTS